MGWRRVLWVIGAIAVFVGTMWGIELFLASRSPRTQADWIGAIQAGATLALVALTAWYAFQTKLLVRVQQATPRVAAQETDARELSRLLATAGGIDDLQELLTSPAPDDPSFQKELERCTNEAEALSQQLTRVAGGLPTPLRYQSLQTALKVMEAVQEGYSALMAPLSDGEHQFPDGTRTAAAITALQILQASVDSYLNPGPMSRRGKARK